MAFAGLLTVVAAGCVHSDVLARHNDFIVTLKMPLGIGHVWPRDFSIAFRPLDLLATTSETTQVCSAMPRGLGARCRIGFDGTFANLRIIIQWGFVGVTAFRCPAISVARVYERQAALQVELQANQICVYRVMERHP